MIGRTLESGLRIADDRRLPTESPEQTRQNRPAPPTAVRLGALCRSLRHLGNVLGSYPHAVLRACGASRVLAPGSCALAGSRRPEFQDFLGGPGLVSARAVELGLLSTR